jgi:hypothetical protein
MKTTTKTAAKKMTKTAKKLLADWLWHIEVAAYQDREDAIAHAATLPAADAAFVIGQANADLKREKMRIEMVRSGELPASAVARR